MHVRTVGAIVCSLIVTGASASAAVAANTGGAAPTEQTAASAPAPAAPKVHTFRITSRSRSVAYKGPVYMKTATGQVVPYSPSAPATATGSAASVTASGGAAPGGVPAAPVPSLAIPLELISGSGMTGAGGPTVRPELLVPGNTARFVSGLAAAPIGAPPAVQQIIWAGNELIGLPYIYGGGHSSFTARGYDCSATVSFALHGAALLSVPKDSSEFERWGSHGPGRWIAIFSNPGHAYMTVAGLRLDTSAADDPAGLDGPRWRPLRLGNGGYVVRHPLGL